MAVSGCATKAATSTHYRRSPCSINRPRHGGTTRRRPTADDEPPPRETARNAGIGRRVPVVGALELHELTHLVEPRVHAEADADKELTNSLRPAHLTREPREDTVPDAAHQPAYEGNKQPHRSRREHDQRHWVASNEDCQNGAPTLMRCLWSSTPVIAVMWTAIKQAVSTRRGDVRPCR